MKKVSETSKAAVSGSQCRMVNLCLAVFSILPESHVIRINFADGQTGWVT